MSRQSFANMQSHLQLNKQGREKKKRRKKQKSDEWQAADGKEDEGEINEKGFLF